MTWQCRVLKPRCAMPAGRGGTHMNIHTTDSILAVVRDIASTQLNLPQEQVSEDATILGDLGADSLDIMEMGMLLEERFEISIPDDAWDGVETVRDLVEVVSRFALEGAGK